jgi:hypothetical protein
MTITGKIIKITPQETGDTWRKRHVIIETGGEYSKTVALLLFNDKCDMDIKVGETHTFHVNVQSREYNLRWYTDVSVWKVEGAQASPPDDIPF